MSQRTLAAVIAAPVVVVLIVLAWIVPLPYVVYRPGPTINVLGSDQQYGGSDQAILQVNGHKTYPDGGQLRMVTVSVTTREAKLGLWSLMQAWVDRDASVYPKKAVYPDVNGTTQGDECEGSAQMASSQDTAEAVALQALGYKIPEAVDVVAICPGAAANGYLKPHDLIISVNGQKVTDADNAVQLVQQTPLGQPIHLVVSRDGKRQSVSFVPGESNGKPLLGISVQQGYKFPFQVAVNMDPNIGGPSAGLMFSLSIYDLLTPGSLTDGQTVAGTGEIEPDGSVGPIGGIQQKIPAAKDAGAKLFLVPADNCADAEGADNGSMRLVKVTTMASALQAIETWTKDPDAALPTCGSTNS